MPTAKFTHDPGTPEYEASDWLITIHNAYRQLDHAIENSPDPAGFVERLRERVARDYEQNREEMGWTTRTRDIAQRALEIVLQTRQ
jgi:vacuolar-type H+-ATPase catalytic subunit A/Vma1